MIQWYSVKEWKRFGVGILSPFYHGRSFPTKVLSHSITCIFTNHVVEYVSFINVIVYKYPEEELLTIKNNNRPLLHTVRLLWFKTGYRPPSRPSQVRVLTHLVSTINLLVGSYHRLTFHLTFPSPISVFLITPPMIPFSVIYWPKPVVISLPFFPLVGVSMNPSC